VKLREALGAAKPLDIKIGDGVLHVTYVPAEYTAAELEEIVAGDATAKIVSIVNLVCQHIKAWDLEYNDRDEVIPLDPDVVRVEVPVTILTTVLKAVQKETQPDPEA